MDFIAIIILTQPSLSNDYIFFTLGHTHYSNNGSVRNCKANTKSIHVGYLFCNIKTQKGVMII